MLGVVILAFGGFLQDTFKRTVGSIVSAPLRRALTAVGRRFKEGSLPQTDHLTKALQKSLGCAARVLAYHLHDPQRGSLCSLLENCSDWPAFVQRLAEVAQNNIVAGTARDHWLAALIDKSKAPDNFADFPFDLILDDDQVTKLLSEDNDTEFREHVQKSFLAWVEEHVPDNGHKPADFSETVSKGQSITGANGRALTFYDVFCVFFRVELADQAEVFRALSAEVLTRLRADLEEIKSAMPDADTLRRFMETLTQFEDKGFDANYSRFKDWAWCQNEKLYTFLRAELAGLHRHLDRQDQELATIKESASKSNDTLAAIYELLVAAQKRDIPGSELLAKFQRQLETTTTFSAENSDPGLRTAHILGSLARDRGLTIDELRQKMLQAAQGGRERVALARQLWEASDADATGLKRVERNALKEMAAAAMMERQFDEALRGYQNALELTVRSAEPLEWAALQNLIGQCHWQIGCRVAGPAASQHLKAQVFAFRRALEAYSPAQSPLEWAMVQNFLGGALTNQTSVMEAARAKPLLEQALLAYNEALKYCSHDRFPQEWVVAKNGIGIALRIQANRSKQAEAIPLLHQVITGYHEVLEFTRERYPFDWSATQSNLGNALFDLARRGDPANKGRLLGEAFIAHQEALKVIPRENGQQWAPMQANLGHVLCAQGMSSGGPYAEQCFNQARTIYSTSLKVFTREKSPQNWAHMQRALGNTFRFQAAQSDGIRAIQLLNKSISTFKLALEVFTKQDFPKHHEVYSRDLSSAEAMLKLVERRL